MRERNVSNNGKAVSMNKRYTSVFDTGTSILQKSSINNDKETNIIIDRGAIQPILIEIYYLIDVTEVRSITGSLANEKNVTASR